MKYRIFRLGAPHEWFDVVGRSAEQCHAKADVVCKKYGWDEVRSEKIESFKPFWVIRRDGKAVR